MYNVFLGLFPGKVDRLPGTTVRDEHGGAIIVRAALWGDVGVLHSWGIAFCCTYAPSTMSCLIGGGGATILSGRGGPSAATAARKTTGAVLLHVNPTRDSFESPRS